MKTNRYQVRESQSKEVIDPLVTLKDAKNCIAEYKKQDRKYKNYIPDFYEIFNLTTEKVEL
jgi:hypothetical protein